MIRKLGANLPQLRYLDFFNTSKMVSKLQIPVCALCTNGLGFPIFDAYRIIVKKRGSVWKN